MCVSVDTVLVFLNVAPILDRDLKRRRLSCQRLRCDLTNHGAQVSHKQLRGAYLPFADSGINGTEPHTLQS